MAKRLPQYAKKAAMNGRMFVTSMDNPRRKLTDSTRSFKIQNREVAIRIIETQPNFETFEDDEIYVWDIDPELGWVMSSAKSTGELYQETWAQ